MALIWLCYLTMQQGRPARATPSDMMMIRQFLLVESKRKGISAKPELVVRCGTIGSRMLHRYAQRVA